MTFLPGHTLSLPASHWLLTCLTSLGRPLSPRSFPYLSYSPRLLLFSRYVVSDSLWPNRLQHARLSHPLPSSGVCSNSCPLSWWCHPTIRSLSFAQIRRLPPNSIVSLSLSTSSVPGILVKHVVSDTCCCFNSKRLILMRRDGNHVVFLELRRDSRVTTGDYRLPLVSALGNPTFYSTGEGKLGVALESLQGQRDLI